MFSDIIQILTLPCFYDNYIPHTGKQGGEIWILYYINTIVTVADWQRIYILKETGWHNREKDCDSAYFSRTYND